MEESGRTAALKNLQVIKERGVKQLETGEVQLFTHQSLALINNFTCVMRPNAASARVVNERALRTARIIEDSGMMYFSIAGRNFPLHATLCEGVWESDGGRQKVFAEIRRELSSVVDLQAFKGLTLKFDALLPGGTNLLLAASEIPPVVLEAREKLALLYERHGLRAKRIKDLLYMVLARINYLPEEGRQKITQSYARIMLGDDSSLAVDPPITVTMSGVQYDETFRFLNCAL